MTPGERSKVTRRNRKAGLRSYRCTLREDWVEARLVEGRFLAPTIGERSHEKVERALQQFLEFYFSPEGQAAIATVTCDGMPSAKSVW